MINNINYNATNTIQEIIDINFILEQLEQEPKPELTKTEIDLLAGEMLVALYSSMEATQKQLFIKAIKYLNTEKTIRILTTYKENNLAEIHQLIQKLK